MDPKYPIGKLADQAFTGKEAYSEALRDSALKTIEEIPQLLEDALKNLSEEQLNTPYREGGWTIKQVAHHLADSHANAYMRFKLALTEDNPTIKPYDEAKWAELVDSKVVPVEVSAAMLRAVHIRLAALIKNISPEEWQRTFYHPGYDRTSSLWNTLALYCWHGKHHVAHITTLRAAKGW
jgi:uncharacterized damage-inducible protein DinB